MYFDSFAALLTMDGHGAFVWSAYLITLLVIAAMLLLPLRRQRTELRRLGGELRRRQGAPGGLADGNEEGISDASGP